jgi:hypothetical protein
MMFDILQCAGFDFIVGSAAFQETGIAFSLEIAMIGKLAYIIIVRCRGHRVDTAL